MISGYIYDRRQGPLVWTWGPASPLSISVSVDSPPWFNGFNVAGENRWDDIVTPKSAYIKSDLNGEVIKLYFQTGNSLIDVDKAIIPGHRKFFLGVNVPARDAQHSSGILVETFRAEFPKFTFVFDYEEGGPFTK